MADERINNGKKIMEPLEIPNDFDTVELPEVDDSLNLDKAIESLKNGSSRKRDFSSGTFRCEYCDKVYPITELHVSEEKDSSYRYKSGILGRGIVEKTTKTYSTVRCRRCTIIHYTAAWLHFLIGLCAFVVICYYSWKEYGRINFEGVMGAFIVSVFGSLAISWVDWLIIRLLLGVKRKP